ncbi:hypothetical protein [Streptomyces californicus]|uniref:hypothetical protein n=1 Tax=Streptomyces californicus TaxID=67351 RepID=UPI003720E4C2
MALPLTGETIRAWQVADFNIAVRRWNQHCREHHNPPGLDHVPGELIPSHPPRHDAYVLTERPTDYGPNPAAEDRVVIHDGPPARTTCAAPSCARTPALGYPATWPC